MKTDAAIKTDIYKMIKGSPLHNAVTGKLKKTKRPHNSTKEDIVISVLANVNGQIQTATVNVNIYVADNIVDNQPEEDTLRTAQLGKLAAELFEVFAGDGYRATLISQGVFETETNEHVINNKIKYKFLNE